MPQHTQTGRRAVVLGPGRTTPPTRLGAWWVRAVVHRGLPALLGLALSATMV